MSQISLLKFAFTITSSRCQMVEFGRESLRVCVPAETRQPLQSTASPGLVIRRFVKRRRCSSNIPMYIRHWSWLVSLFQWLIVTELKLATLPSNGSGDSQQDSIRPMWLVYLRVAPTEKISSNRLTTRTNLITKAEKISNRSLHRLLWSESNNKHLNWWLGVCTANMACYISGIIIVVVDLVVK